MQQQEIHKFLERFFLANECEIIENHKGYLTVQLTVELDKQLMNRPFYWHYIEKIGQKGDPAKLTFITDQTHAPTDIKGEVIHFGSPRLHQIFQATKKLAAYIRMYENIPAKENKHIPLYPWLGLNIKISYQCDRKKEVFKSIGLQLINGVIVEDFHNQLLKINLTKKIPDYTYTISPLIMPKSGVNRIIKLIKQQILEEDHEWAIAARKRWQQDLDLLENFYEDKEEKGESYEIEKKALQEQYEPKVKIHIVNGGLFYLCASE